MYTLEGDCKNFEVNSLFNSEPVKLMEVLSHMRMWMKVKDSTDSKVLYSLELGKVSQRCVEKKRVALVEF